MQQRILEKNRKYERFKGKHMNRSNIHELSIDSCEHFMKRNGPNPSSDRHKSLENQSSEKNFFKFHKKYSMEYQKKVDSLNVLKNTLKHLFIEIKTFFQELNRNFERMMDNSVRIMRKELELFLNQKIQKHGKLLSKHSEETACEITATYLQKRGVAREENGDQPAKTGSSFNNPIKVRERLKESAGVAHTNPIKKLGKP